MESTPEEAAEGRALVTVLSCVLNRLMHANCHAAAEVIDQHTITKFHALKPPAINVSDYLSRILKYSSCSNECFVLALIYIDRLIQGNNFALNLLNVHRVVITSVMIAAKFFDDQYFNNAYYAKVGGVPCSELNSLETEFLFRVNFGLYVELEEYMTYRNQLSNHARNGGCDCGCQLIHIPPYVPPAPPHTRHITGKDEPGYPFVRAMASPGPHVAGGGLGLPSSEYSGSSMAAVAPVVYSEVAAASYMQAAPPVAYRRHEAASQPSGPMHVQPQLVATTYAGPAGLSCHPPPVPSAPQYHHHLGSRGGEYIGGNYFPDVDPQPARAAHVAGEAWGGQSAGACSVEQYHHHSNSTLRGDYAAPPVSVDGLAEAVRTAQIAASGRRPRICDQDSNQFFYR